MNVRHAYIFEHKHTRAKESCTDSFKRCLDFHPPSLSLRCPSSRTHTRTQPPPTPTPTLAQRQSVRAGSEESVCRAPCPAASWKAVDFEVFRQVIAAGKLLLAHDALVWFHSGVGAAVSGELVGPGEPAGKKSQDVNMNIKHVKQQTSLLLITSNVLYSLINLKVLS